MRLIIMLKQGAKVLNALITERSPYATLIIFSCIGLADTVLQLFTG
jgi:hypothetical protein